MCSPYFQNNVQKNNFSLWNQKRGNNEGPEAQVCAVCLDSNRKLYMMTRFKLAEKYENLTGYSFEDNKDLPQTLCSECTQRLINCSQFRDKCLRARSLMLKILKDNESLTMHNIKAIDRDKNLLTSNIVHEILIPNQCDVYIMDDRVNDNPEWENEEVKLEVDVMNDSENIDYQYDCIDIDQESNNDAGGDVSNCDSDVGDNIDCGASNHSSDDNLSRAFNNIKYRPPSNSTRFEDRNINMMDNIPNSANSENDIEYYRKMKIGNWNKKSCKMNLKCDDKKAYQGGEVKENGTNYELLDINITNMSENTNAAENSIKSADLECIKKREIRINLVDISKSNHIKISTKAKQPNKTKPNRKSCNNKIIKKRNRKVDNITKLLKSAVKCGKINQKTMNSDINIQSKNNHQQATVSQRTENQTDNKQFICDHCQKVFSLRMVLVKHMRAHTVRKPFTCNYCGYRCLYNSTLVRHVRKHTDEKPFACSLCDYKCRLRSQLTRHENIHTSEKRYLCHMCSYKSNDQSTLKKHIITHSIDKPYSCKSCKFKCKLKSQLTKHMRTHSDDKPYACEICEYTFKHRDTLNKHMATHTGEKRFSCQNCSYICNRKDYLTKHMATHTGEKSFSCPHCSYRCHRRDYLTKHMATHTDEKRFSCQICSYRCHRKEYLSKHMETHTGGKLFSCQNCSYRCKSRDALNKHIETHTGPKHFSCPICSYRCTLKKSLAKHMTKHTDEKPI